MIILSNGFGQFHLSTLVELLEKNGRQVCMITGATLKVEGLLTRVLLRFKSEKISRLISRHESMPSDRHSLLFAEMFYQLSRAFFRRGHIRLSEALRAVSYLAYQIQASFVVMRHHRSAVYHYRSGFGGLSAVLARRLRMKLVCDHSIAHPKTLLNLGILAGGPKNRLPTSEKMISKDIARADIVLVNSNFVRKTCIESGVSVSKIVVAQTPVPKWIMSDIDRNLENDGASTKDIAFIGTFEHRKGCDIFINAAAQDIDNNRNWIVWGEVPQNIRSNLNLNDKQRLKFMGVQSRSEIIRMLAQRPIVVFPTRAEGSSRAIAEALCAGCYVITTEECGSVIEHHVTGAILSKNTADEVSKELKYYDKLEESAREQLADATQTRARKLLSVEKYYSVVSECYNVSRQKSKAL